MNAQEVLRAFFGPITTPMRMVGPGMVEGSRRRPLNYTSGKKGLVKSSVWWNTKEGGRSWDIRILFKFRGGDCDWKLQALVKQSSGNWIFWPVHISLDWNLVNSTVIFLATAVGLLSRTRVNSGLVYVNLLGRVCIRFLLISIERARGKMF